MRPVETGLYVATVAALGGGLLYEHKMLVQQAETMKGLVHTEKLDSDLQTLKENFAERAERINKTVLNIENRIMAYEADIKRLQASAASMQNLEDEHHLRLLDYAGVTGEYINAMDATERRIASFKEEQIKMRGELIAMREATKRIEAQSAASSSSPAAKKRG